MRTEEEETFSLLISGKRRAAPVCIQDGAHPFEQYIVRIETRIQDIYDACKDRTILIMCDRVFCTMFGMHAGMFKQQ